VSGLFTVVEMKQEEVPCWLHLLYRPHRH